MTYKIIITKINKFIMYNSLYNWLIIYIYIKLFYIVGV